MNPKIIRKKLGLTQSDFWTAIGVSQCGGSRYEGSKKNKPRRIPKPTEILLTLYYGKGFNFYRSRRNDVQYLNDCIDQLIRRKS